MKRNLQKSLKGSLAVGKPREVVDLNIIFRNVAKILRLKICRVGALISGYRLSKFLSAW